MQQEESKPTTVNTSLPTNNGSVLVENKVLKELPLKNPQQNKVLLGVGVVIVLLGLASGWALAGIRGETSQGSTEKSDSEVTTSENIDDDEFPLIGEGILKSGGVDGDGTHTLSRDSESDVILLSTVLSLDSFINKKVQVWGKTLSATSEEAGWLVDVTKVKVLE